jgi:pullulanase
VAYVLHDHANGDIWKDILVIYNGGAQPQRVAVPGKWTVVADAQKAGLEPLRVETDRVDVGAASLVVAHADE